MAALSLTAAAIGAHFAVAAAPAAKPGDLWSCSARIWDFENGNVTAWALETTGGVTVTRVSVDLPLFEASHWDQVSAEVVYGMRPGGVEEQPVLQIRAEVRGAGYEARPAWRGSLILSDAVLTDGPFDWGVPRKGIAAIGTLVARIPAEREAGVAAALDRGDTVRLQIRETAGGQPYEVKLRLPPRAVWLPRAQEGQRHAAEALARRPRRDTVKVGDYTVRCWQSYPSP